MTENKITASDVWFNIECCIKEIRKALESVEHCNLCEEDMRKGEQHECEGVS